MRAVDLAVQHEWNLEREPERHKATAHFATRTIRTPPIHGDLELAVFVHEGGHLESPMGDRDRIDNELLAWRWGMKMLGFRWSGAMQHEMEACLRTYQPLRIKTYQDLQLMEAVFAEGAEQAGPARSETMNRTAIGGNGQRTYGGPPTIEGLTAWVEQIIDDQERVLNTNVLLAFESGEIAEESMDAVLEQAAPVFAEARHNCAAIITKALQQARESLRAP